MGKTSQGLPWELRYDNGKSSSASVPKVYWEMTQLKANRKVFEISRGKSFEAQKNPQGQGFAAGAALMVGASSPDELDFIREASVLPVGSRRLRERFKVIARSEADVAMLVTAEIENLLLNWPSATQAGFDPYRATKIICDSQSLRVELKYDTSDMPLFEHLVKLGVALADRVSGLGTIEAR